MVASRDLRWVQGPIAAVAAGDGEHCSRVRSDKVQDGTSCGAKQREGRAVSPIAGAGATIHLLCSLSGVRVGRARETNSLNILPFPRAQGLTRLILLIVVCEQERSTALASSFH